MIEIKCKCGHTFLSEMPTAKEDYLVDCPSCGTKLRINPSKENDRQSPNPPNGTAQEQSQSNTSPKPVKEPPRQNWKIATIIFGVLLFFSIIIPRGGGGDTSEKDAQITDLTGQVEELTAKVNEAQPWFEMNEADQKALEDQLAAQKAEEKAQAAAAAAAAQAEVEQAEKVGYETGITYDQLARTPDDYSGQKVKFSGKVIQVIEGDNEINLRIATDGNYDNIILAVYDPSIVSSRVLEDDTITIHGVSAGLYTYESTLGGNITVPSILVDRIDQ